MEDGSSESLVFKEILYQLETPNPFFNILRCKSLKLYEINIDSHFWKPAQLSYGAILCDIRPLVHLYQFWQTFSRVFPSIFHWRCQELNRGPPVCKASVLPLSYVLTQIPLVVSFLEGKKVTFALSS